MRCCGCILLLAGFAFADSGFLREQILKTRGEPLRELPGLPVLHVRDYGAVPNDGTNDFFAIQSAVAALGSGHAELRFESGVYEVNPGDSEYRHKEPPLLFFQGLENVVVDGQGASILIQRPSIGFSKVRNCTNIIICNFTIDYDPLPFSQGMVVAMDDASGWIEVETDSGFPDLNDPFFEPFDSWGMLKDPAFPGKLKDGAPNVLFRSSCTAVGTNRFRLQLAEPFAEYVNIGDRYVQNSRAGGGCEFYDSEQVTFENVTFHACPGSLFVGTTTSHLNVLNCRGKLKDGRLMVNGADGVHCQAARIGPWVEGCEFEGLSDDCLNVYSLPLYVVDVLAENRFRMSHSERISVGDPLVFFRPQTGEVLAETTVISKSGDVVTLADAVIGLNLALKGAPYNQRGWKIYDHAYNPNSTGNWFVYRNNYMHDGRRFGGFIKASYGLIENNRFERLSDNALQVQNEPGWPEGFFARNLVIRNNQMLDCGFRPDRIPVQIDWSKLGHRSAQKPLQKNIFFESNTVRAVSGPCAEFNCIDGLTLSRNTFESGNHSGPLVSGEFSNVWKNENNTPQDRIEFE